MQVQRSLFMKIRYLLIGLCFSSVIAAAGGETAGKLYFISPQNGAVVSGPVTVQFGLTGFGVAPAGIKQAHTGHHHLLIDTDLPPMNLPVPSDANHLHFGGGQTETTIELPPGEHTLQLLLGDFSHIPHDPPLLSERITITVE